jgi:hypothetical protein
MTREELFEKYHIDESHAKWDNSIDNWMSVEVYRVMHEGNLPPADDTSVDWITGFLDKVSSDYKFRKEMMSRADFGGLFLTSKRMVNSLSEEILKLHQ